MNTIDNAIDTEENVEDDAAEDRTGQKQSLRAAVNQTCKDCIYDEVGGEGNWKQQVAKCTVSVCGLYSVRPISKPKKKLPSSE